VTEPLHTASGQAEPHEDIPAEKPLRRRRWVKRLLLGVLVTVVLLAGVGAVLYEFGGMSRSVNDPAIEQQYKTLVVSGAAQPVPHRLVIGIPGCQCHSSDPVLTEQHRNRRIRECSNCHAR
jgi:hypothetical protein